MKIKIQRHIFLHMTLSGLGGGALLGALYGTLFFPGIGTLFGAIFGGVAGLPMGIANGVLMWLACRSKYLAPQTKRRTCYVIAPSLIMLLLLLILILDNGGIGGLWFFFVVLPAIIATGASVLAVDRYFAHHPLDSRKRKRKEKPT